jgi:pentapeptide MXKDX repeat protein
VSTFGLSFVDLVILESIKVTSCDGECQADRGQGQGRGRMSRDRMSRDRMSRDRVSRDRMSRDRMSRDRMSRDRMSRDRMSRGGSTIPTAFSCPGFKFLFQFYFTNFLCVIRFIKRSSKLRHF